MFIDVGAAKLYATGFGPRKSTAIVGIGGWIGSGELWAEPFSLLSATWRTIAYDHRGSGASIAPPASITHDRLVADLFAVLDAFDIERCCLAAESAGALTAIAAALQDPGRIARLVVVDGMYHRGIADDQDPFLQGLKHAYAATLSRFVELCVPEDGMDHVKRWGRQIIDRATPESAIALRTVNNGVDLRGRLAEIGQPTLVVHGERDAIVPIEQGRHLAATLPNARMVVIAGAGHVPTLTRPVEVAEAMAAFLREHPL